MQEYHIGMITYILEPTLLGQLQQQSRTVTREDPFSKTKYPHLIATSASMLQKLLGELL